MRKRAGLLAEISLEFAEIIGRSDDEHAIPLTGIKSEMNFGFCRVIQNFLPLVLYKSVKYVDKAILLLNSCVACLK